MSRLRAAILMLTFVGATRVGAVMIDAIQVDDGSINAAGQPGLAIHANTTLAGRSDPEYPGEITPHHGIRVTPDFCYGLGHSLEAGLSLPVVRTGDGDVDLAGVKVRLRWVPLRADERRNWFLGASTELAHVSSRCEEAQWGVEWRAIAGYRTEAWLFAVNPVLYWELSGADRDGRPDAGMQVKLSRTLARGISIGPEYYSGFGRLGRALPCSEQEQTLYAAIDVDRSPWVFNFGVGRGLTRGTDQWTVKAVFGLPW